MSNGTWEETLAWLNAQVGYHEEGYTNRQKYAAMAGHANGFAWCASFIAAAMKVNKVPVPAPVLVASSRRMFDEAKLRGLVLDANVTMRAVPGGDVATYPIRPGDIGHKTRGLRSLYQGHVVVVKEVLGNGRFRSIEGNTNAKGSATGGSVLSLIRTMSEMNLGFWRPDYKLWRPPVKTLWAYKGGIGVPLTEKTARLIGTPNEVQIMLNQGWIFGTPPKELTWVR